MIKKDKKLIKLQWRERKGISKKKINKKNVIAWQRTGGSMCNTVEQIKVNSTGKQTTISERMNWAVHLEEAILK